VEQWVSEQNEFLLFLVVLVALVLFAEVGHRIARRMRAAHPEATGEVSSIQGAVLGLLALLLGFTFAMAAERFQARKELVRDEANAIGTVALRTQLLPEPQRSNVAKLLPGYVENRIELQQKGYLRDAVREISARAGTLQAQIWAEAVAAAERAPQSVMIGLFVSALNDMIDMDGKQLAALRNRIPAPIFLLLFLVAIVAVGITGYGSSQHHRESASLTLLVSLLIASVIILVVDLHRPARGLITIDLSSLTQLRQSVAPPR